MTLYFVYCNWPTKMSFSTVNPGKWNIILCVVTTVVSAFNRYWSGSNPAKLGKSIEIHLEMEFWDSQHPENSPRTRPDALEHVSACFPRVSVRYTAWNLRKLIKIYEIHPKFNTILQIQAKSRFQNPKPVVFTFWSAGLFLDPPNHPRLFLIQ